jgi:hypothetical protein
MTTTETLQFDRLNTLISEGRVIRGSWTKQDDEGRDTACLLAALYPPCGVARSEAACPSSLMPGWLASLTVWIDDSGTPEKWPGHIKRYAAVIRGVVALDAAAMAKLSTRIRVLIVREAMSHITRDEWGCKAACEQTIEALESGDTGKIRAAESAAWSAARSAAESAAGSAAWSAAGSAAESAAGSAAWSAARSAARSAAWSAAGSAAWSAARSAAWSAAWSAAEDRLIDGVLTAMEEAASPGGTDGGGTGT